jgi:hypothetical protein
MTDAEQKQAAQTQRELKQKMDSQIVVIKREIYQLKKYVEQWSHVDHRVRAMELVMTAYRHFDAAQEYILSRG